jgi:plasmid stabilization system protein ParE
MVIWSERALTDLFELSSIEKNFSFEIADKTVDGLVLYVEEQLKNNKELGRSFELNPHYRYLVFKGNRIFYTPYEDQENIYVVHINARTSEVTSF